MTGVLRISILGSVLFFGVLSCEKESDKIAHVFDDLANNTYYDSEILSDSYIHAYGNWKLFAVSGGIHGGGHEPDFDFLEIKRYGIYAFLRNDSIIEFGRINIDEQTNEILLITFESDENSETIMYDPEKYVNFYGKDTLSLDSPCCDRYNYHFLREK